MSRSTKDGLMGSKDLVTAEVVIDLPNKGDTVLVRSLPAAYSNQAQEEALETRTWPNGQTTSRFSASKLEVLKFQHGVIEPEFSKAEVEQLSTQLGPAWRKIIEKIDELSGTSQQAAEAAEARFPAGDANTQRPGGGVRAISGSGRPADDLPVGAGSGHADKRAG